MAQTDDNETSVSKGNNAIIWIAHKAGFSGLIVIAALFDIARLANNMSPAGSEALADFLLVLLWAWLKFLSPAYFRWVWKPLTGQAPRSDLLGFSRISQALTGRRRSVR